LQFFHHAPVAPRGGRIAIPEQIATRAMLSQRELRDAAVNFGTHRSLQWHCAVSLPQHGFNISDR